MGGAQQVGHRVALPAGGKRVGHHGIDVGRAADLVVADRDVAVGAGERDRPVAEGAEGGEIPAGPGLPQATGPIDRRRRRSRREAPCPCTAARRRTGPRRRSRSRARRKTKARAKRTAIPPLPDGTRERAGRWSSRSLVQALAGSSRRPVGSGCEHGASACAHRSPDEKLAKSGISILQALDAGAAGT